MRSRDVGSSSMEGRSRSVRSREILLRTKATKSRVPAIGLKTLGWTRTRREGRGGVAVGAGRKLLSRS